MNKTIIGSIFCIILYGCSAPTLEDASQEILEPINFSGKLRIGNGMADSLSVKAVDLILGLPAKFPFNEFSYGTVSRDRYADFKSYSGITYRHQGLILASQFRAFSSKAIDERASEMERVNALKCVNHMLQNSLVQFDQRDSLISRFSFSYRDLSLYEYFSLISLLGMGFDNLERDGVWKESYMRCLSEAIKDRESELLRTVTHGIAGPDIDSQMSTIESLSDVLGRKAPEYFLQIAFSDVYYSTSQRPLRNAIKILKEIGGCEVFPEVVERLSGNSAMNREVAQEILFHQTQTVFPEKSTDELVTIIRDRSRFRDSDCFSEAIKQEKKKIRHFLAYEMNEADLKKEMVTIETLITQMGPGSMSYMIKAAFGEDDTGRRNAKLILEQIGGISIVDALITKLNSRSSRNRFLAGELLVDMLSKYPKHRKLIGLVEDLDAKHYSEIADKHAFYIMLGREGSEDLLLTALDEFFTKKRLDDFLNCGNSYLSSGSEEIANEHGYEVRTITGVHIGPRWGENQE